MCMLCGGIGEVAGAVALYKATKKRGRTRKILLGVGISLLAAGLIVMFVL